MKLWSQFKFIPLCTCYLFDARKTWEHTDSEVREFDILLTGWTCCCVCDEPMRWGCPVNPVRSSVENPSGAFTPISAQSDFVQRSRRAQTWTEANPTKDLNFGRKFSREQLARRGGGVINAEAEWFMDQSPGSSDASGTHRTWCLQFCFFKFARCTTNELVRRGGDCHTSVLAQLIMLLLLRGLILMTVSFTTITKQVFNQTGCSALLLGFQVHLHQV